MQWFKRQSRRGKLVILAGASLLFICLCARVSPTPEATPTPTETVVKAEATATSKPARTVVSPTPEAMPTPTEAVVKAEATATPEQARTLASLGEEVRTEKFLITISEVKRARWLLWNDRRLEPDGQWVIVYGEAQNLTTEKATLYSRNFKLTTPSLEGEIEVNGDATGAAGLEAGVERTVAGWTGLDIKAGQSWPLVIAFDVPNVVEQAMLWIADAGIGVELGSMEHMEVLPTPAPTNTPIPTNTPVPTDTPIPTDTPLPTNTPPPTDTPVPTVTPIPPTAAPPTPKPVKATATSILPTATSAPPTPTPGTLPTEISGPVVEVTAWVDNPTPTQNSTVTVFGKFTIGNAGIAGVPMDATWRYKSTDSYCDGVTDAQGIAICNREIAKATKGYTVRIDVVFVYEGKTYRAQTSFTPH